MLLTVHRQIAKTMEKTVGRQSVEVSCSSQLHGHPDLQSAITPRTEKAISSNKQKRKAARENSGKEKKGREGELSVNDVAEYIPTKKIKSRLQLMSIAAEQNREGR